MPSPWWGSLVAGPAGQDKRYLRYPQGPRHVLAVNPQLSLYPLSGARLPTNCCTGRALQPQLPVMRLHAPSCTLLQLPASSLLGCLNDTLNTINTPASCAALFASPQSRSIYLFALPSLPALFPPLGHLDTEAQTASTRPVPPAPPVTLVHRKYTASNSTSIRRPPTSAWKLATTKPHLHHCLPLSHLQLSTTISTYSFSSSQWPTTSRTRALPNSSTMRPSRPSSARTRSRTTCSIAPIVLPW